MWARLAFHRLFGLPGWVHRSSDFGRDVYLQASVSSSSNWGGVGRGESQTRSQKVVVVVE